MSISAPTTISRTFKASKNTSGDSTCVCTHVSRRIGTSARTRKFVNATATLRITMKPPTSVAHSTPRRGRSRETQILDEGMNVIHGGEKCPIVESSAVREGGVTHARGLDSANTRRCLRRFAPERI
jgi:hypothetical protein